MKQHEDQLMDSYKAIMAQRDAAILERNIALTEKKKATNDRDIAILQRDAVISERNSVIAVRNNAIAQLHYKSSSMDDHTQQQSHMNVLLDSAEAAYNPRKVPFNDNIQNSTADSETPTSEKVKRTKTVPSKESPNFTKKSKRGRPKGLSRQHNSPAKNIIWKNEQEDSGGGFEWDDESELNQVNIASNMRIGPVCSCTGKLQPCYKWGSGGWQSACCTTTLSMFPLPHRGDKPHQRIGGRKMSGGVYTKLVQRLVKEGHDLSFPVDLKEHWARHGTNRYITIK